MLMLHSHRLSWHQGKSDIVDLIKKLRWDREVYANLRCELNPGCSVDLLQGFQLGVYEEMWGAVFAKHGFGVMPGLIKSACCAQFMVPRSAVLRHPLAFYEDLRQWVMHTESVEPHRSAVFEYAWHIMFGNRGPIDCPPVEECRAATYRP